MAPRSISLEGLTEPEAKAIEEQVRYLRELAERKRHADVRELPRWPGLVTGRLTREEIYEGVPSLGPSGMDAIGKSMTIIDLLTTYAGAVVTHRRDDPEMAAAALAFADGRRMILLERTYRIGVDAIQNPTDDDFTVLETPTSDLVLLWNSGRAEWIGGNGASPHRLFEPVEGSGGK